MKTILKQLNFRGTASSRVLVKDVPIGSAGKYKELFGDETPDEFINTVKLGPNHLASPYAGLFVELTTDWAQSYADAVNSTPGPLYLRGHEDEEGFKTRAIPFGYVVGAKVVDSETLALRNAFKITETEEDTAKKNQALREIKAGMLSTSTGDYAKFSSETDDDTGETLYKAIESRSAQTNALVEFDQTGSDASIISTTFKGARAEDDNKPTQEDIHMEKKQAFELLKNLFDAGKLGLKELGTGLGVEIMTSSEKIQLKNLNEVIEKHGSVEELELKLKKDREETFDSLKELSLKAKFKDEEIREMATELFTLKTGTKDEIDQEVERVSQMKAIQKLAAEDVAGSQYKTGDDGGQEGESSTGPIVM